MNDDLISRNALKEHKFTTQVCNGLEIEDVDVVAVATIDNAQPVINEYTKGFADGERSGRNYSVSDEEKAILVRQWRPKSEWINDSNDLPVCKECGEVALQRVCVKVPQLIQTVRMVRSNYCPNCGADMKGKEKKNE